MADERLRIAGVEVFAALDRVQLKRSKTRFWAARSLVAVCIALATLCGHYWPAAGVLTLCLFGLGLLSVTFLQGFALAGRGLVVQGFGALTIETSRAEGYRDAPRPAALLVDGRPLDAAHVEDVVVSLVAGPRGTLGYSATLVLPDRIVRVGSSFREAEVADLARRLRDWLGLPVEEIRTVREPRCRGLDRAFLVAVMVEGLCLFAAMLGPTLLTGGEPTLWQSAAASAALLAADGLCLAFYTAAARGPFGRHIERLYGLRPTRR